MYLDREISRRSCSAERLPCGEMIGSDCFDVVFSMQFFFHRIGIASVVFSNFLFAQHGFHGCIIQCQTLSYGLEL